MIHEIAVDTEGWRMTDQQQLPLLPPHRNHGLFADHYLDRVLSARPEWRALAAEAEPIRTRITEIFAGFVPSEDEAQTEKDFIRPVLDALGFDYEVNVRLRVPGTHPDRPDYAFYRDDTARQANKNTLLDRRLPAQGGFAVGDAKRWNRPLDHLLRDGRAGGNENPAYQIHKYLLYSGVEWGILTNGKLWRLVHRDTADRLDVYYEVDLEEAIRSKNVDDFRYFYAFFRRTAFDPGPLGLSELLNASTSYARDVGASLKVQVYDALRHLAQGFLDYESNGLGTEPETLQDIYDNALILLYRLIFILYAEARELLPIRENAAYRETYSLQAMVQAVARELTAGRHLLPSSARRWPQLKELFGYINAGKPPLHIATFNGGLFDPEKHPFLEQYAVGDYHLQQAIDKLARVHGEFIDYRDLAVRHMGTIYEGLLEYHLQPILGSQAFRARSETVSLPIQEQARDACDPRDWSIDLVNDKGERKATGSYYTPDYVVKFMVDRAVGPALREAIAGRNSDVAKVQAVLDVNIIDPATGSGHFLVEAVEYIARFLVDLGVAPAGKTPEEADLAFWKRRVVQSCIYGVDLNPLAVELAKLSLWLVTVAKDRPLSFLDHHLRPGNSLVGARLEQIQPPRKQTAGQRKVDQAKANGQISLFDDTAFTQRVKLAVDNMWLIEESEAHSVGDVKNQEVMYESLRRHFTAKYARLLNLVTATGFGVTINSSHWPALVKYVTNGNGAAFPAFDALLRQADEIAARERFFHWELEFPEIFFDRVGRHLGEEGGFEVVIGNPPYIRQEKLATYKPYLQETFRVFHGVADLYLYFYERGLEMAKHGGRLAFISSGTFARANFAGAFRTWLPTVAQLETLIDFGENQPFPGAEMVRPSIVLLRKTPMTGGFRSLFIAGKVPESLDVALDEEGTDCAPSALEQSEWTFQAVEQTRLFQKIMTAGNPLGEVVNRKIYYGIKTGLNEAFIIDQQMRDRLVAGDSGCAPVLKKMLRGEDLRPWYQEDEGRWLIALPCGWTRRTFGEGLSEDDAWQQLARRHPSLATHLLPFAAAAQARWDKGDYWWELRSCDYYDAFDQQKIFWPDIAKLPRFSIGDVGVYIGNTGYLIPNPEPVLLGLLQSRILWFAISQICQPLRLRAGLWQYRILPLFVTRLPIPVAPPADRKAISALAMTITERARERYALHQRVRHRLLTDLGTPGAKPSTKLTAWWTLDFPALRAEVKKVFKRDIPLADRDDWESWHAARRADHARLMDDIVRLETELNARVYALFGLTAEEIAIIEESTKYRYGEV